MDILSIAAAICSTSASLPQLYSPKHVNTFSMALRGVGGLAWSTYGMLKSEWALCASSLIVVMIETFLFMRQWRASVQKKPNDILPNPIDDVDAQTFSTKHHNPDEDL